MARVWQVLDGKWVTNRDREETVSEASGVARALLYRLRPTDMTGFKGRPLDKCNISPRPHQPEPPALWHTHGHGEFVVCHVQHSLPLTQHQGTAAITMWTEAGIGVAWQGVKKGRSGLQY